MPNVAIKTNSGLGITTNRLMSAGTEPKYVGWGTGTTTPTATDTGLITAASESRTTGTGSRVTTNTTSDTYQVDAIIICASAAKTIAEVATFDASTGGNVDVRGTFSGVYLEVGESIAFTIKQIYDQA